MLRDPYITAESLRGMQGMVEHIGEDLQSYKERQGDPPVHPDPKGQGFLHPKHAMSEHLGGMEGEMIEGYLEYALSRVGEDPAIAKALRDVLMMAKLSAHPDALRTHKTKMNARLNRRKTALDSYKQRLGDYNRSMARTIENYHKTRADLEKRWARFINSLNAAVKKDPDITTMAWEDQSIFGYLNRKGLVTIRDNIVISMDPKLQAPSHGAMQEIIRKATAVVKSIAAERERQEAIHGAELFDQIRSGKPRARIAPPEEA